MFNVWRMSTIVFVLQAALGLAFFAETKNTEGSVIAVFVTTFMVMSGLTGSVVDDDVHAVSLPACSGVLAVLMAVINAMFGLFVAAVFTLMLAYMVAAVGARNRREPGWMIFVSALPLGIGMIVGGGILLYRRLYETGYEPAA